MSDDDADVAGLVFLIILSIVMYYAVESIMDNGGLKSVVETLWYGGKR